MIRLVMIHAMGEMTSFSGASHELRRKDSASTRYVHDGECRPRRFLVQFRQTYPGNSSVASTRAENCLRAPLAWRDATEITRRVAVFIMVVTHLLGMLELRRLPHCKGGRSDVSDECGTETPCRTINTKIPDSVSRSRYRFGAKRAPALFRKTGSVTK